MALDHVRLHAVLAQHDAPSDEDLDDDGEEGEEQQDAAEEDE